ncbi:MAG: hypothetical protein P4L43_03620 [Syntrophobacteraceae bacterium]|nr:hypothetical protein [Syntrophobacteraceae bacterium]
MKSRSSFRKPSSGCRLTLIILLVLAAQAWAVSVSLAGESAGERAGQTVVKRPLPGAPAVNRLTAAQLHPKPLGAAVQGVAPNPQKPFPARPLSAVASAGQAPIITTKGLPALSGKKTGAADSPPLPGQLSAIVKKTSAMLDSPGFTFLPDKALDPFVPFISLQTTNEKSDPGAGGFLTPLQKMSLAEMETGLRAIAMGGLGKMAVIEDSTGKGFIVGVGTPAGPNGGVIKQIQDTCLVVQQEVWNSQTRQRVPEDFTVKMVKKNDGTP